MIIIPARLASTRFNRKILADIFGLPMVIKTAYALKEIDRIVIATDSQEVIAIANNYGIEAVLTSKEHQSGTDRINEAATILQLKDEEIIINVQADEPFIEKEVVQRLALYTEQIQQQNNFVMTSCYKTITKEQALDSNQVKVVINNKQQALYFSRSLIPFDRDNTNSVYYGHLGLYAFDKKSLSRFCSYGVCELENIEKLEQLRALSNAKTVHMLEVTTKSFGIDTQADLEKALQIFG